MLISLKGYWKLTVSSPVPATEPRPLMPARVNSVQGAGRMGAFLDAPALGGGPGAVHDQGGDPAGHRADHPVHGHHRLGNPGQGEHEGDVGGDADAVGPVSYTHLTLPT